MEPGLAALFHEWHDFYILVGTASATLVGLMFVAASIGSTVFSEANRAALAAFITPTVVHFASVLFACFVVVIPSHTWHSLGLLLGAGGIAGAVYSGGVLFRVIIRHSFNVDLIDRMFYALIPMIGYLLAVAAALLLFEQSKIGADLIAVGLLVLLFAGVRNAWDMMVWIVLKVPGGAPPSPPAST
jgi:hypothetical protein